ncbi:hypothetical protein HUU05_00280 [candidate division KSB1 bacterium]|nr:hypothetical protein [candidate division KSB1 bacterium]
MLQTYQGVIKNGAVVFLKPPKLTNGTRVLIMPQNDSEKEWLTAAQAAKRFQIAAALIRQWMKSGKVRVAPHDIKLVNAGDVEDAVEQHELLGLSMQVIKREE